MRISILFCTQLYAMSLGERDRERANRYLLPAIKNFDIKLALLNDIKF